MNFNIMSSFMKIMKYDFIKDKQLEIYVYDYEVVIEIKTSIFQNIIPNYCQSAIASPRLKNKLFSLP